MTIILKMTFELGVNDKKLENFIEVLNTINNNSDNIISAELEFIEIE